MIAELITIGDELLIGQVTNTNAVWMAQQLNQIGISVKQITCISDSKEDIIKTLNEAQKRAQIILITGGLGPTKDDITKHTLCEYFNTHLVFNEDAYKNVERLFALRGFSVSEINKRQAEVPANCIVIPNNSGTAPGMWFNYNENIIVSMPGVPYEMKGIMQQSILPELKKRYKLPFIYHKTILTQGVGESYLSEIISDWEDSLIALNLKLAYLPSPGMVRLRISGKSANEYELKNTIENKTKELEAIISQYIYGFETYGEEPETIQKIIGTLLKKNKKTLSVAESCTGGYISHLITSVAGSSEYFTSGVSPYNNNIKKQLFGVPQQMLDTVGAVSEEVVKQLVIGSIELFNTDYAISVSGIAGPGGATAEKPVGTVWIAVGNKEKIIAEKYLFGDDRERNIQKSATTALNMLRKFILNESEK
ncbi:MAG: competence/damage-inducible protein A [Bacteroidetes bacterium]|nr:competence/damage-inducible protein A [Bacteroidota bacterium]